nr:hypothetical protein [Tanacetum cinerariifolium]
MFNFRRTSLTGFPAQSIRSSNVIALDSPYLLVLITGRSQNRQHDKVAQALEILKLKRRVKNLEKKRGSKSSGLKRLRKVGRRIKAIDADEDITPVDMETKVDLDVELQGRIKRKDDDNVAAKEVNTTEPNVFDDEEMQEKHLDNIRKYQSLKRKLISIAQARKNIIVYLKNMAGYKMEHFRVEPTKKIVAKETLLQENFKKLRAKVEVSGSKEYNKVQTLFKPDKDVVEPTKKIVAKETLLQENFKKLRAKVEVSGSKSTQETPTIDIKEMSKEDVQNMLQIILVYEFKVEALQVKYPLIDWEIHSEGSTSYWKFIRVGEDVLWKLQRYMHYLIAWNLHSNCGVHQVSLTTRRHDMYLLTKKDYPLSNGVMTLMLSTKLQVEEDSEMARDLVMKIFMKANQPKSRSLDTSSKRSS